MAGAGVAVGVCGFPRSGSSMMMRLLDAGGVPPIDGSQPVSYELSDLNELGALTPAALHGAVVKLLDAVLWMPVPAARWKFIWCDRDPSEQAKSLVKFSTALGLAIVAGGERRLRRSLIDDRPLALSKLRAQGDVLVVSYEATLADPAAATGLVAAHLAPHFDFDRAAAAGIVHQRSPKCAPDLAFEGLS